MDRRDRTASATARSRRPTSSSTAARGPGCARTTRSASTTSDLDAAARPRRPARPARGRGGLPPAVAAAQLLRRGHRGPAPRHQRLPRRAPERTPFVIGVAGSVAVGKSTTSRILRELLARWPGTPRVELITTDGFLYPNAELERRGLLQRKGFPESYDRRALLRFVAEVKAGAERGQRAGLLPPDLRHRARRAGGRAPPRRAHRRGPQRAAAAARAARRRGTGLAVSDFFDFSVYVDARIEDIRRVVRRPLPPAARDGVRRPQLLLPPLRRALRRRGPRHRRAHLGDDQRAQPRREHPARRAAARRWCCPRARTTASAGSACASSEHRRYDGSAAPRAAPHHAAGRG